MDANKCRPQPCRCVHSRASEKVTSVVCVTCDTACGAPPDHGILLRCLVPSRAILSSLSCISGRLNHDEIRTLEILIPMANRLRLTPPGVITGVVCTPLVLSHPHPSNENTGHWNGTYYRRLPATYTPESSSSLLFHVHSLLSSHLLMVCIRLANQVLVGLAASYDD